MIPFFVPLALWVTMLLASPPSSSPRIYLSWSAPYGAPGAREWVAPDCTAEARPETLFLCFDPGRERTPLWAATATLQFLPAQGESLETYWRFPGNPPESLLRVEYAPGAVEGALQAWAHNGMGGARYRSTSSVGTLRLIYAVPPADPDTVQGGRLYLLARIIIAKPPPGPACRQALCIQWEEGSVAISPSEEPIVTEGVRFVGWNRQGAAECERFRRFSPGAKPWEPPRR